MSSKIVSRSFSPMRELRSAIIAAVVAALVASGATYAGTGLFVSRTTVTRGPLVTVSPGERGYATADCPSRAAATGGGITSSDISGLGALVTDSAPAPLGGKVALGWTVAAQNNSGVPVQIQAYAVCAR